VSLADWILLVIALAGIARLHVERRRDAADLAVERGRGFLGQSKETQ